MTDSEIEDTVADPYMGFNLGSMKVRQTHTRGIVRHVFESPLLRLIKDHGYSDVYEAGAELPPTRPPPARSIWIYRYYESASADLGTGRREEIESYAQGLKRLLDDMQSRYARVDGREDPAARSAFRAHLVAHSMGGLIARCLLQKVSPGDPRVDKVFTYGTPHGGISFQGIGNVPGLARFNDADNFNHRRMREYLGLPESEPVNSLGGKFPPERFFSLIGTNHRDYGVALGMARRAVGPMSDGLVRIENAYVAGGPRSFVHRAHSGHYGIVNSEEGYQNLRRFLFGNVQVDAFLDVHALPLPPQVQQAKDAGKKVRASYHIEVVARVRGARWDLHRRTVDEESAIFKEYDDLVRPGRRVHLASMFLLEQARVDPDNPSLGFSLDLRVLVPEYVVDGYWLNRIHHEGGYLFRDKINFEARQDGGGWRLRYGVDSRTPNRTEREASSDGIPGGGRTFTIPVEQATQPGLKGMLHIEARPRA